MEENNWKFTLDKLLTTRDYGTPSSMYEKLKTHTFEDLKSLQPLYTLIDSDPLQISPQTC